MLTLSTIRQTDWRRRAMTDAGIGWLALSTSLLAGSTYNVFAKMLSPALSPLSLVFVSECVVLTCVLLSFGVVPVMRAFMKISSRETAWLFVIGLLSGIFGPGLWFLGLNMTSAINAGFFGKSEIIFTILCATFILRERVTRAHVAAMCTIFAGMAIISLQGFTNGLTIDTGDMVIIASTVCFALSNVLHRKFLSKVPAHVTIAGRSITALTIFMLLTPFVPESLIHESFALPAVLIPALIGFGLISRFINGFMYYEALERLPIATISLVGSLDVILSTAVAFGMLGEPVYWYDILGGCFVLLGTLLLELLGTHPTEADLEEHIRRRHR